LPLLVARALAGRASQSGAFEVVQSTELIIDTRAVRRIDVAVDGEVMAMSTPRRFKVRPGALPVVVARG
jgi:diacylglycerol kinase family enzyme